MKLKWVADSYWAVEDCPAIKYVRHNENTNLQKFVAYCAYSALPQVSTPRHSVGELISVGLPRLESFFKDMLGPDMIVSSVA
jgi:hypothetical protein